MILLINLIKELSVKVKNNLKKKDTAPQTEKLKKNEPENLIVKPLTSKPKINSKTGEKIFFGGVSIREDFEPDTDDEDEPWWELNGEKLPHIYKVLHYRFLGIQLLDKPPELIEEVEVSTGQPNRSKGYGSYLTAGVMNNKVKSGRELSVKSYSSKKSFRATLKNSQNEFRSLSISKIKQNFKFQILLGNTTGEVKKYFGCVSSCFLDGYLKYQGTDEHFLRRKAKHFDYNDKSLRNINEKLKDTPSFKPVNKYDQDEMLEHDSKVRQSRSIMGDFTVDVWMFEVFFGKALRYDQMATETPL